MKLIDKALACLIALLLGMPLPIGAQQQGQAGPSFTAEQLDQIAAPIALYPDPLLAQIFMASTYPLEVVQAARFVKDNPSVKGDQLDAALKNQTWDDSVKSLVTFPQVLSMMDAKLDWTQKLGDAFLGQEKELMNAVQRLRASAQKEGNLKSTPEQTVTVEPAAAPAPSSQQVVVQQAPPTVITIQPTNPQVVYVPTYNPTVVYGAWPYPAYPPYSPYPPGYAFGGALLSFGVGMAVGGALWGNCNWGGGNVNINTNNYNNYTKNVNQANVAQKRTEMQGNRQNWQHNPEHRQGVQYRDSSTQQRYNRGSNPQATQARENYRGRAEQGRQDLARGGADQFRQGGAGAGQTGAQRGAGPGGGADQFRQGGAGAGQTGAQRGGGPGGSPGGGAAAQRGGGQAGAGGQARGGGSAFQGMGDGRQVQNQSNRGQSSRQSMSAQPRSSGGQSRATTGGGASRGGGGGSRGGGGGRR